MRGFNFESELLDDNWRFERHFTLLGYNPNSVFADSFSFHKIDFSTKPETIFSSFMEEF